MNSKITQKLLSLKFSKKRFVTHKPFVVAFTMFCMISITATLKAQTIYAVSSAGDLVSFNATAPGNILTSVPLTGLATGQTLQGMDFRPATGQLYALGYNSTSGLAQLYLVKTSTGVATPLGTGATIATGIVNLAFDFNPTVDRIRVIGNTGQNYRLNPNDGTLTATDTPLAYATGDANAGATPAVYTVGYTNNMVGASTTGLYFNDINLNVVGLINPPNNGTLNTIGSSTIAPASGVGPDMDITTNMSTGVNTAYLTADVTGGGNNLYTVNLSNGNATFVGAVGTSLNLIEMAIYLAPPLHSRIIYGISSGNLISFNSSAPGTILSSTAITGLAGGETILGIDFRPATGELFALGSGSRLYTINLTTAVATQVGVDGAFTLNGSKFGFDFNPTVDRIRLTSDLEQNLRLNPNNGALAATDLNLAYNTSDVNAGANPRIEAVGYTNSFAGSTATTLYGYDFNLNILTTINPPNNGTINTVGSSGITAFSTSTIDMDIASDQVSGANAAFLSASTTATGTNLYRVNTTTGTVSLVGAIGSGLSVSAIAIYIQPQPLIKVVYALSGNNLVSFNSNAPATITSTVPVTGVTTGQVIEGLDFRPANGQLYALGYNASSGQGQVYTIATSTGIATAVGSAITLPVNLNNLSFDFNPTVDRIRLTSSTGQNYRLNPNDGSIAATDTPLNFAPTDVHSSAQPRIYSVAYTNSFAGSTATQLYYYDFNLDKLATTVPPTSPNTGTINTVGNTDLVTLSGVGLDLDIASNPSTGQNTTFLSANVSGNANNFYLVDVTTGETRLIGTIGTGAPVSEIAISASDVTLPVTLLNFTAKKEGTFGRLMWATNTEINNEYFVVERSRNGREFSPISKNIASKALNGNSTTELSYSFEDVAPLNAMNYYRLLQVDKDGNKRYSQIVRLQFDGSTNVLFYPNPVKSKALVSGFLQQRATLQVMVIDGTGKLVKSINTNREAGDWNIELNMSDLPGGMYFIQLYSNKVRTFSSPVIKN